MEFWYMAELLGLRKSMDHFIFIDEVCDWNNGIKVKLTCYKDLRYKNLCRIFSKLKDSTSLGLINTGKQDINK